MWDDQRGIWMEFFKVILFEKNKVVAGVDNLLQWTLSPRSCPIDLVNDSFNIDSDK